MKERRFKEKHNGVKIMKKALSTVLALAMVLALLPVSSMTVYAERTTCSDCVNGKVCPIGGTYCYVIWNDGACYLHDFALLENCSTCKGTGYVGNDTPTKTTVASSHFTFTAPTTLTAGTARSASVVAARGVTGMGDITVYYSPDNGLTWSSTAPSTVGTYKVAIDVTEGTSYTAGTKITDDTWTFTLSADSGTWVKVEVGEETFWYDSSVVSYWTVGFCSYWQCDEDCYGRYEYYYRSDPKEGEESEWREKTDCNHIVTTEPSSKTTSAASHFTFTAPSTLTAGTARSASVTAASGVTGMGDITVYYSSDNGSTWSSTAPSTAGTYKVAIDVTEGDSYTAGTKLTADTWTFTLIAESATVADYGVVVPSGVTLSDEEKAKPVTQITSDSNRLAGWYVVDVGEGNTLGDGTKWLGLSNNSNIILKSGALNVSGISGGTCNLTIWTTADGNGELIVNQEIAPNNLTINGGTITATGDEKVIYASNITINGGIVTATSLYDTIYASNITINAGTVTAKATQGYYATPFYAENGIEINENLTVKAGSNETDATVKAKGSSWKSTLSDVGYVSVSPSKTTSAANHFTFTAPSSLIAGTARTASVVAASGVTGMGDITVYYSSDNGSTWSSTAPSAAGTYKVAIDVTEGTSYTAGTKITADTWTFTLTAGNTTSWDESSKTLTFIGSGDLIKANVDAAFDLHPDATKVVISGYSSIMTRAFQWRTNITEVTLPSGLKAIYNFAFQYCHALSSITLPSSLTVIYNFAFDDCSNLSNIVFQGTEIPTLNPYVFSGVKANGQVYLNGSRLLKSNSSDISNINKLTTGNVGVPQEWFKETPTGSAFDNRIGDFLAINNANLNLNPTREGYTFVGWSNKEDNIYYADNIYRISDIVDKGANNTYDVTDFESNTFYYAVWKDNVTDHIVISNSINIDNNTNTNSFTLDEYGISWDKESKTLTLTNAVFEEPDSIYGIGHNEFIYLGDSAKINLVGENRIGRAYSNISDMENATHKLYKGVRTYYDIEILGSGDLTIYDYECGIEARNININGQYSGNLTIYDYGYEEELEIPEEPEIEPMCALKATNNININGGNIILYSLNKEAVHAVTTTINGGYATLKGGTGAVNGILKINSSIEVKASNNIDGTNLTTINADQEDNVDVSNKKYVSLIQLATTDTTATAGAYTIKVPKGAELPIANSSTTVTKITSEYLTNNSCQLAEGWYVVDGNVDLDEPLLESKGNVNIILKTGTFSLNYLRSEYVNYAPKYNIAFWTTTDGNGTLKINSSGMSFNDITINGGNIAAHSAGMGDAIYGNSITINAGIINAKAQYASAIYAVGDLKINETLTVKAGKTSSSVGKIDTPIETETWKSKLDSMRCVSVSPSGPIPFSDYENSGLAWELSGDNKTLTITKTGEGNGLMQDYSYYESDQILPPWEDSCAFLTSIIIGEGVTHIGEIAFSDCYSLTSLAIPDSVVSIGSDAFNGCSSLTSLIIPGSVSSIGNGAFYGGTELTSITFSGSMLPGTIGAYAFCNAGENSSETKTVYIANSDETVRNSIRSTLITSAGLPSAWTIAEYTSISTIAVESIKAPVKGTALDTAATCETTGIATATPTITWKVANEEKTGTAAASTVYTAYVTLETSAGYKFAATPSVTIGGNEATVTRTDDTHITACYTFAATTAEGVTDVTCSCGNHSYVITGDGDNKTLTIYGTGEITTACEFKKVANDNSVKIVTISSGITVIGEFVFDECTTLISVNMPSSLRTIGNNAFNECTNAESLSIPSTVTSIGENAFRLCKKVESITIPENVTELKAGVFQYCEQLEGIIIPENITTIGNFAFDGCVNFKNVVFEGTVGTNGSGISTTAFYDVGKNENRVKLTVPSTWTSNLPDVTTGEWNGGYFGIVYNISNTDFSSYGTISVSDSAIVGTEVTVSFSISQSQIYEVVSAYYEENGATVQLEKTSDNVFTFTMPAHDVVILTTVHEHGNGTKIAGKASTCAADGWNDYYQCSCGKYYTDSACTNRIANLTTWKTGAGKIDKKAHTLKTTTTKATLTANGKIETKCTVCSKVTKTTVIYAAKTFKLSATAYTYDGKEKKPTVSVKDSKGNTIASSNYTLTYATGRKNVGKYSVKVTFKGNYSGYKTLYYNINPPATSISSVTAGKKAFTVKWAKKTTQVTGYEIQYSTTKDFKSGNKTVKVTSAKTVSKTISKLTGGKKYYVRVRTYTTVSKVNYYSNWSAVKAVTTKK